MLKDQEDLTSLLQMKEITKSFPGVKALQEVDFDLHAGEIHALLGANGAGKSTLMKILSGAYKHDTGYLSIHNQPLVIRTPKDAMDHGVYCVYQEVDTALISELTVTENVMIDKLVQGEAWVSWRKLHREAEAILAKIGAMFSVRSKIDELSISQKQLVLIARAMAHKAKIIIFDEPTAPLSLEESERLFRIMDSLKQEGVGIIFISHRLQEVFRVADRITIMRDGRHVLTQPATSMDIASVIEAMLGKTFTEEFPKVGVPIGSTLLEVKGLRRGTKVRGVSFDLRRGEILGIVGLVGAGKTELSRLIFGADAADGGEVWLNGRKLTLRQPEDAVRAGIALVPEERRKQGVLVEETVKRNLSLPILRKLSTLGFVKRSEENAHAAKMVSQLGVQPGDPNRTVKHLSGGNQQKVAVGKWLPTNAEVYMFDEPTKGVDVGAKSDIYRLIGQLASEGKGIIYLSCELNEIIGIADRIIVMSYGSVVKELSRAEATQDLILTYASAGEAE
ncbi:Ribose import ATP-binding protein RbsA [Paenibacillus allorhizoplanae]|uniref:Ribose import ATP-binding protein RbsA n=1 Tax=Paenibacillus allorhizoplanae TaxID=2905648 RepID=A0ABN8GKE9_9BACL|nr:sugar ABC transporter ATP-binding protein [Paenibacillus allorhizoplanae]CAH1209618.1 Ribose import ATP-binding protein RbsA [Paenibacillus allorhizoplanae]